LSKYFSLVFLKKVGDQKNDTAKKKEDTSKHGPKTPDTRNNKTNG